MKLNILSGDNEYVRKITATTICEIGSPIDPRREYRKRRVEHKIKPKLLTNSEIAHTLKPHFQHRRRRIEKN